MIADLPILTAPTDENALAIFNGEWSPDLAERIANFRNGDLNAFQDPRILWACSELGGVAGQNILELGPFEAQDTCVLEMNGATSITAVERNPTSYLRCLVVKEIAGLKRAQFLCGDYAEFLRHNSTRFDLCVASGVLYRVTNAVEFIGLCARAADQIFVWTHYYEPGLIAANPVLAGKFVFDTSIEFEGFQCAVHGQRQAMGVVHGLEHGVSDYSFWMTRDDILACFRYFGFIDITTHFEEPDHPNGPSFALIAKRRSGESKLEHASDRTAAPPPQDRHTGRWSPAEQPIVTQAEGFSARLESLRCRLDVLENRVNRYANLPPLHWLRRARARMLGLPAPR